ncbi:MAG: hypothetical protein WA919_05385 [Coleofasciculaceae cyanobacterium]
MVRVKVLTLPEQPSFWVLLPDTTSWSQVNRIVRYRYGQGLTSVDTHYDNQWRYMGSNET